MRAKHAPECAAQCSARGGMNHPCPPLIASGRNMEANRAPVRKRQRICRLLRAWPTLVGLLLLWLWLAASSSQNADEVRFVASDAPAHAATAAVGVQAGLQGTGAAGPQLDSCELDVRSLPVWEKSCQLLSEVCVDQRTIILFGEEYQKRGRRDPQPLPLLQPTGKQADTYSWHYRNVSPQHPATMSRPGHASCGP